MSEQNAINQTANLALQQGFSPDWAITTAGFANVRANFAQIKTINHDFKALEQWRSDYLNNTFNVKVRDGVAIIPVTGPIFTYLNWYMYYFGGTAMTIIARDFQTALDNPNVYSILFEFDTPGGEVIGGNEFAKMIYAARSKKPMTARVGGLCCSMGIWWAAACGDIKIDETSILGSIGVQTVYFDDTKFLEMNGFEEIVLTSDISPKKNLPPTDDVGKQLVKNRLNALANIFASFVGVARDVPLKTVLRDFGQGDVFVGQEAIDAGLADGFASFEEALSQLANAHTPENIRTLSNTRATLNPQTGVAFLESAENGDKADTSSGSSGETINLQTEETTKSEEPMATENEQPDNSAQTKPENQPAANTDTPTKADFEALTAKFEAAQKANQELADRLEAQNKLTQEAQAAAEKTKLTAELTEIAKDFAGDRDEKVSFMATLSEKFGRDSAELKNYISDQTAIAAQIAEGELFKEQGKSGAGAGEGDAFAEMTRLAETRAKDKGITTEQAMIEVAAENPELYKRYDSGE